MALADYKIRVIANACITRFDNGEGIINFIVQSYNMAPEDETAVLAYIFTKRPDIDQITSGA